jgi:hypothetical protein
MTAKPAVDTSFLGSMQQHMGNGVPQPLVLKRYGRQVEQLLTTDVPEMVWVGRMFLAALAWDFDRANDVARSALTAVGPHPSVITNVAIAFQWLCDMDAANEYGELAYDTHPGNVVAAANYLLGLYLSGHWTKAAAKATEIVERIGGEQLARVQGGPVVLDLSTSIPGRIQGLQLSAVPEARLQRELRAAWAILREQQIRLRFLETMHIEDPDSGWGTFYADVCVSGDIEMELHLNALLATPLSKMLDWEPTTLSVAFKYREQGEHDDQGA